jgi:CRISPR/Cas system CSM-associated protein Csm3 (group 7 of RAMP superfamily)
MELSIAICISSETAFSIGSGGGANMLNGKSIWRNAWDHPILPGSHLKGKVRHTAEQILNALDIPNQQHFFDDDPQGEKNAIRRLFGSPRSRGKLYFSTLTGIVGQVKESAQIQSDYEVVTGKQAFDLADNLPKLADLLGSNEQKHSLVRPSVAINRQRGTSEDRHLSFQETSFEQMQFVHSEAISGEIESQSDAALIWAALKLINRWGGGKSRGLGWGQSVCTVRINDELVNEKDLATYLGKLGEAGK